MEPQAEPRAEEARGRFWQTGRRKQARLVAPARCALSRVDDDPARAHARQHDHLLRHRGACPVGAATSPLASAATCVV